MIKFIVNWLMENGADESDREVYLYSLECILNELIADLLLILCGILASRLTEIILWLVLFTSIRINLGGYHAKTHIRCIMSSTLLGCACIMTAPLLKDLKVLLILFSCFSFIIIIKLAPVIHKHHPVPDAKKRTIKYRAIFFASLDLVIIIFSPDNYFYLREITFLALFSATCLSIMGYRNHNEL